MDTKVLEQIIFERLSEVHKGIRENKEDANLWIIKKELEKILEMAWTCSDSYDDQHDLTEFENYLKENI